MTDIDDQPDPINWRTTGRKPVGSLVKGSVTIPSSIPSVPTKYITILNPDCHEKKGFLHQAVRFPAPPESEAPDPGVYYHPIDYNLQSDSFSKHGYGNFASKSRRFPIQRPPTMVGVGQYNFKSTLSEKGVYSPFFQPSVQPAAKTGTPGPGTYTPNVVESKEWWQLMTPVMSSFKSTVPRVVEAFNKKPTRTAPGLYEVKDTFEYAKAKETTLGPSVHYSEDRGMGKAADYVAKGNGRAGKIMVPLSRVARKEADQPRLRSRLQINAEGYQPSASGVFQEDQKKNRTMTMPNLPTHTPTSLLMPSSSFNSRLKRNEWTISNENVPGPGSYDPHVHHVKVLDELKETHPFAEQQISRFGDMPNKPKWDPYPGPGQYQTDSYYKPQLLDLAQADPNTIITSGNQSPLSLGLQQPQKGKDKTTRTWGDNRRKPGTLPAQLILQHNASILHPNAVFLSETHRGAYGSDLPSGGVTDLSGPVPVTEVASSGIKNPGPAYYHSQKPSNKTSFHIKNPINWV